MKAIDTIHPSTTCFKIKTNLAQRKTYLRIFAPLCFVLLISACTIGTPTASPAISSPTSPVVEPTSVSTQVPTQIQATVEPGYVVNLDLDGLAQAVAKLELPAVQPGTESPGAVAMPQRELLWLYGYPVNAHSREPQIFLFAVKDLEMVSTSSQAVQDLQALLQGGQEGKVLPFLPPTTNVQQMHAKLKTLDFKNGKGVRFLTQYANGMAPINNQQIFYTFQGITQDGKTYIAVVLPVFLNGLPSYPTDTSNLPLEFTSDFGTYVASVVNQLNLQAESDYAPDLTKLDALVQSIEVK